MKKETRAIISTKVDPEEVKAAVAPLHLATTYLRSGDGSFTNDYRYARLDNPNRRALEGTIAQLEKGAICYAFSSGMAAITAVFQSLQAGDHVVLPDDVFFNVRMLIHDVFQRWGLTYSLVDMSDLNQVVDAFTSRTKLVWIESPSNPLLKMTDMIEISRLARQHHILVAVDNTWLTPILLQPFDLGADLIVHSSSKYFGGHSDAMGGCVVIKTKGALSNRIAQLQVLSGAVPAPFDCWLIKRGIKTLALRIQHQSKTAEQLALFLEKQPKIDRVFYPGLKSHPEHALATRQLKNGFGAMLSVLIKGNTKNAMEVANRLNLFTCATSLGSVESLVEHRQSVEGHYSQTPHNLLRISVGAEHLDDLIADWDQALKFN